jgi:hypothetical protein
MLLRLMSFLLFLLAANTHPLHAQDDVFAGWTPEKTDGGLNFKHNSSDAFVSAFELPGTGPDKIAELLIYAGKKMPPQCGDMTKATKRSVVGDRLETFSVDQKWNCMIAVMPGTNGNIIILAVDMPGKGADSRAIAYALIAKGNNKMPQASKIDAGIASQGWPKGGLVTETRADIDWQAAWKMGLNPDKDLLPSRFECFNLGLRTPNPAADGALTVNANGRYSYNSKTASGQGTWQRSVNDNVMEYRFAGALTHREDDNGLSYVQSNEYGQSIILAEAAGEGLHIACYQSGPAAEYARLQMASTLIDGQTWQCKFADGVILPVQFSNGRYQSQRGGGIYRDFMESDKGDRWNAKFEFDGGPFANAIGDMQINEYGQRSLTLGVTVTKRRGYWYVATETKSVAQCVSEIPRRQYPQYGTATVPATGITTGPSGEYTVFKYDAFNAGSNTRVYSFFANGWYLDEAPEDGPLECNRTKPSGEPFCLRYELAPGKIRLQSTPGRWDDDEWETYVKSPSKFTIGGAPYEKMKPLTGLKLAGTYMSSSGYSSGDVTSSLSTLQFLDEFVFTADGQFSSVSDRSSFNSNFTGVSFYVPSIFSSSFYSSSSSSSKDNSGRYRIEGNWLILTNDDGAEVRKFIHLGGEELKPNEKPEYIYIGDSLYALK